LSISDEDTDAGSDFIELQPISEYEENKENIYLGIDPISSAFSLFLFTVFSYLILFICFPL
jgi:hypothetical protein